MILLFCWDCSTLPDLTVFDLFTDNNKSLCLFRADEKAARSLHYKLPGRQNKPNDGASHGAKSAPAACGRVSQQSDTPSLHAPPALPTSGAVIEQEPFRLSLPVP